MIFLNENDSIEIQGSGKNPYKIKKIGGVVSCSCPSWLNMGKNIDTRICKHIKANVDPNCLLPQAKSRDQQITKQLRITKTGKVSTAVGGAVVKDTAPPVLLAHRWEDEDPTNWWASEKLDGVRAWWDGSNFISRLGNIYHAPDWFKAGLPKSVLDGELWAGRKKFQKTVSAVRKLIPDDAEWANIKYLVYDAPEIKTTFEERIKQIAEIWNECTKKETTYWEPVPFEQVSDKEWLQKRLALVESCGGEGLMIRQPGSLYESGKSKTLLKVKSFFDAEAEVIAYTPGKGKHKGRMGACVVRMDNGLEFEVGGGFTDKEREAPPSIGSKITYKFTDFSERGIPKNATFISARDYE